MALHFFKLINNEVIFGDSMGVPTGHGEEIQIKEPFTIVRENGVPYMSNVTGNAPAAIQIHPMNVLWSVPLDEFPALSDMYKKATSKIEVAEKKIILPN